MPLQKIGPDIILNGVCIAFANNVDPDQSGFEEDD